MVKLIWRRTGLYPILDLNYCSQNKIDIFSLIEMWESFPKLIDSFQLRAKSYFRDDFISIYKNILSKTKLPIIINDYWEIAIELKAYGFHVGKEDFASLSDSDKNKIKQAQMIKGTSSHSLEDLQNLDPEIWTYTGLGPIFQTGTKKSFYSPLGTGIIREALEKFKIPIVPIGGINSVNFWSVAYIRECKPASISLFSDELLFPILAREYQKKLFLTENF